MVALYPTTELVSAHIFESLSSDEQARLKQDPKGFIYSYCNFSADDVDISVVENGVSTVHLVLPCYGDMPANGEVVGDSDLADVSGGEIAMDYTRFITREEVRSYSYGYRWGRRAYSSYGGGGFGE